MSSSKYVPIKCPHCGTEGEFDLHETINAKENPQLREKIIGGELFNWECPKCGHKVVMPYGTIYHDPAHRFMIIFQAEFEKKNYGHISDIINSTDVVEGYVYRRTNDVLSFKEKLLILENGLNDLAVERLKYGLTELQGASEFILLFVGVNTNDKERSEYGSMRFLAIKDGEEPRIINIPMDTYYEHKLAVEIDPRMKADNWAVVNQDWLYYKLTTANP